MAIRKQEWIAIADLRGGRNDTDPPMSLPDNQCVEALNIDWKDATLGRKRGGADAVSLTGGTAFNATIASLLRHVPGASEGAAELWAIDGDSVPVKRLTGGTAWANVTMDDAVASGTHDFMGASLNGKLFLAFDSAVDRLHVYDPGLATPRVRRVGFATPAAPTAANGGGAGAYAATLRYYRVRWLQMSGTTVVRRSEPGASVSFTPGGANANATVTQPAVAGEGETHWEIEASTDNTTWVAHQSQLRSSTQIAIATTTYADTTLTSAYTGYPVTDTTGLHARFPSVKYLITDGNRLLGTGAWETAGADSGGRNSRIWFTPVLGSADKGDDERSTNTTTQKNFVDLNENDGGFNTGLGGPVNGVPYAFKYRQVWKLRPTGDVATPYLPRKLRDDIGCIAQKTIAIGEDQQGRAALYFLSHRGPYRVTSDGDVQYLGRDNEVTWRSINLASTSVVGHSVYYPDLHQWWVWIATAAANLPDVKMVFDVQLGHLTETGQVRGGWAKHTGASASVYASCLFSNTLGATMSSDLKPHVSTGSAILKCDVTATTNDAGTNFQAYVTTKPLMTTDELGRKTGLNEVVLLAKTQSGVTITLTIDRDFGAETRTATVSLTAVGSETRAALKFDGSVMGEANVLQLQVGDAAAASNTWTLDAMTIPLRPQESR